MTGTDRAGRAVAEAVVAAPARTVYELLTGLETWPRLFPWILHTEPLERDGHDDVVRYWGITDQETIRTWVSRRHLDPDALRMKFEQEGAIGEVARLTGSWSFTPGRDGGTRVEAVHAFEVAEGAPTAPEKVAAMFHGRTRVQLARLTECAEGLAELDRRTLSFSGSLSVRADPAEVHRVLAEPRRWPELLPDVVHAHTVDKAPGVHFLELAERDADGDVRTSRTARLVLPGKVVFKDLSPSGAVTQHTGQWRVAPAPEGATVTVTQAVVLDPGRPASSADVHRRLVGSPLSLLRALSRPPLATG
ncbi:SRPBCC family protein [Streptomyces olivaceoviridis]|uniref:SRPBCC family protein n=1 Tax=Streptomyces olivaceoviridis TaxID=1921 RepID=UPI00367F6EFA